MAQLGESSEKKEKAIFSNRRKRLPHCGVNLEDTPVGVIKHLADSIADIIA